jgi:YD repeat-containing protein
MRLSRVTDAAGDVATLCRDALGRVLQTNQPLDAASAPADDCRGHGDGNLPPAGYITREFTYDFNGNVRSSRFGGHATLTHYDQFDRLTKTEEPGSVAGVHDITTLTLDDNDNVTDELRPNGHAWVKLYDSADRVFEQRDPLANRTTYGFDPVDNVTSLRRPRGNEPGANAASFTTTYTFNRRGEMTKQRDGQGNETNYEYDLDGNQKKVELPTSCTRGSSPRSSTTGAGCRGSSGWSRQLRGRRSRSSTATGTCGGP